MSALKKPMRLGRPSNTMGNLTLLAQIRPATLDKIEKSVITLYASDESEAAADSVTMQSIAKHANVSLQTLYKYFGDKNTLIYVILDRVLSRLAARMIDHLSGIDSVKDRLRKTLWVMFDFVDHNPDAVLFF
ncbi:TetR/AcrR family transcriptional regulator, partial [Escherichia coli]|nr:TetR/AcrR family transcriptional regulator [Escherichia coli]